MQIKQILRPFNRAARLVASLSVRTRIIVLAMIPVVGFIANGMTYVSGEGGVGAAFYNAKRATALSDASRDFKIAIAAMRITVKDFTSMPSENLIAAFEASRKAANKSLDAIENSIQGMRADDINSLHQELGEIESNFTKLVSVQRTLGFTETEGLRNALRDSGNKIEKAINDNLTWLAAGEAEKLMMDLLIMRHHEAEYRLSARELTRQQFLTGYRHFTTTFANIDGTPEMKSKLENEVKIYAETFAKWIEVADQAHPLRALIDIDSQNMLPRADTIIESANGAASRAAAALAAAQIHTRMGIIEVGLAMVLLGIGFSWLIGRSITRPLSGLADVMQRGWRPATPRRASRPRMRATRSATWRAR